MDAPAHLVCIVCEQSDRISLWAKAQDVEYFVDSGSYNFYECTRCRALQMHPIPKNRLSEIYPKTYYSFATEKKNIATRVKAFLDKLFFRHILQYFSKSTINILDVGGGTGWLLDRIRAMDSRIGITQVVDISPEACPIAVAKGHHYFLGTIEQFKSSERFEIALLLNLIEHVEDPKMVFNSVRSSLSDDGLIVIKTPNYDSLDARIFRHRNWGGLHCPRHWHIFSKNSLVAVANQCGLKLRDFRYTQGAPFWAVSVMAALFSRKIVSLGYERPTFRHPLFSPILILAAIFDFIRGPFFKTSQMILVFEKAQSPK